MNGQFVVLHPAHESNEKNNSESGSSMAERLESLENKVIAVINNGKRNSDVFLKWLCEQIQSRYPVKQIVWIDKSNPSLPLQNEVLWQLRSCHAVIAGVGD
ncbi:hypothetical protein [Effusibacillus lacus]|uniref:UGSC-like domain-containing protein n=2 Tax=Effusibacillus lacus TaxID=1348429 RepID=A0A292YDV7_9BACL|nr:hypothetical protein [Effusibacillus lacus]TCS70646.1 hypothetical protein EDD64_13138 [Effusibacillus lacus]GAX90642.1 hypothetical protein [Effusibacillus lacus]